MKFQTYLGLFKSNHIGRIDATTIQTISQNLQLDEKYISSGQSNSKYNNFGHKETQLT